MRFFSQPTSAGAAYSENVKLGIISDTHGLLRPEVLSALRGPAFSGPALSGIDRILHLGDVGKASILDELAKIAPVTAIRGNVDIDGPCAKLPETDVVLIENPPHAGVYIYMLHDLKTLHLDPAAARFAAVLHGHTHVPNFITKKGVLYFNPGSCGPRRFDLPVTIGILTIEPDGHLKPQIVHLPV